MKKNHLPYRYKGKTFETMTLIVPEHPDRKILYLLAARIKNKCVIISKTESKAIES